MTKIGCFFDLNCLIKIEQRPWVVDKTNPSIPLYKFSESEFKLIKSGIYKSLGNKIEFSGRNYYLPNEVCNKLKIILIKKGINFSNLAISLQEFLDGDIVNGLNWKFNLEPILNRKNDVCDFYIICSKQTKETFQKIISELEKELLSQGIKIKNFYFINENFTNQDSDEQQYKKIKLILQHSVGYKSDKNKFTNIEITKYDVIHFHDSEFPNMNILNLIDNIFVSLISNTDEGIRSVIRDDLNFRNSLIYYHQLTSNLMNPLKTFKYEINSKSKVRKFESFKLFL